MSEQTEDVCFLPLCFRAEHSKKIKKKYTKNDTQRNIILLRYWSLIAKDTVQFKYELFSEVLLKDLVGQKGSYNLVLDECDKKC